MTLLLGSGASMDRSSPALRSSSKAPNRTRPEERVCIAAVHKIQNTKLYQCAPELSKQKHQGRLRISLTINNFLISLRFHRNVTAVPFTTFRPCAKQTCMAVIYPKDIGFAPCQGAKHP